jgi:tetratricopeptide (TPR) repeat protein
MTEPGKTARTKAIRHIFERTMGASPHSRDYVLALVEAANDIAGIDAELSERTAREACLVAEELRDMPLVSKALSWHAWTLCRSGQFGQALLRAERAAYLSRIRSDEKLLNTARYTLAWIRARVGDIETAESIWTELIRSTTQFRDDVLRAKCHLMYGLLLLQTARYAESCTQQFEAHTLFSAIGNAEQVMAANNAALALLELGDRGKAIEWAVRALENCPADAQLWRVICQHTLGRVHMASDEPVQARTCFESAKALLTRDTDDMEHAILLHLDLGRLATREGHGAEALAALNSALMLAQETGDSQNESKVHAALQAEYTRLGDFTSALTHCGKSRKALHRDNQQRIAEAAAVLRATDQLADLRKNWALELFVQ